MYANWSEEIYNKRLLPKNFILRPIAAKSQVFAYNRNYKKENVVTESNTLWIAQNCVKKIINEKMVSLPVLDI